MTEYKQQAGQKQRLALNYDATREVVAQAESRIQTREEMTSELGASNLARRVALAAVALGRICEMSRHLTRNGQSNLWAAKDADDRLLRAAGRQSSAPL